MTAELEGWLIVVTRAEPADGALGGRLRDHGARVLHLPTVEVGGPDDPDSFREACERVGDYDWVVFTSARAVNALAEAGADAGGLPRVAVVGSATAAAVRDRGWSVALEGRGEGGVALARSLLEAGLAPGQRVLFPASSRARPELEDVLASAGVAVHRVTAYETRVRTPDFGEHPELGAAQAVTFTSPSAVEGWRRGAGSDFRGPLPPHTHWVAIGETTGGRLREFGVVPALAPEPSFEGIVECLRALRRRKRS